MREYFEALIPEPVTILGLRLKPFSAGHIALLHRVESPFVTGKEIAEHDLALAVMLCAMNHADGVASLDDSTTPDFMDNWKAKVGDFDFEEKKLAFTGYIARASEFPMAYIPKHGAKENSINRIPFFQHVRATMAHYYGVKGNEFLDMPWGLVLWDYYSAPVLEGAGDLAIKSELDDAKNFADELFKKFNPHLFEGEKCQS